MADHLTTLKFALEKYPEKVEAAPVAELVMDSARQSSKRPAYLKLAVPDAVVQSLRGSRTGDVYLLVRIPGEIGERADSRIVLPGEV